MISEKQLIEHCSLTLSSLKTASLFTVKFTCIDSIMQDIDYWNKRFFDKGITLKLLRIGACSALIYMFREDMLRRDLSNPEALNILARYDYHNVSMKDAIKILSTRLTTYEEFPHEIGLFLGYPPKDVEGFICNEGKNCSLCKYWKVYGNTDEAILKFAKYDKCKEVYKRLWQDGRDIMQLTVKRQSAA